MSEQSDNSGLDYDTIRRIAKKINKISDKKLLVDIIKIIKSNNPDVVITENENGMFIKFNTLTQHTYKILDGYIKKKIPKHDTESDTNMQSEYIPYNTDDIDNENKFKYSTQERSLIKKQQYASQLNN